MMTFKKIILLLAICCVTLLTGFGQELEKGHLEKAMLDKEGKAAAVDYFNYHNEIISAEEKIFLQHDETAGLTDLKNLLEQYKFCFIDDCILGFQMAIYLDKDTLADFFIRKAIHRGFKRKMLAYLKNDNLQQEKIQHFLKTHTALDNLEKLKFDSIAQTIDTKLLTLILKWHCKDQSAKNNKKDLGYTVESGNKHYSRVIEEQCQNLKGMLRKNVFPGEKNVNILSNDLLRQTNLKYPNFDYMQSLTIGNVVFDTTTYMPIITEKDYFGLTPFMNLVYHCPNFDNEDLNYFQLGISQGYFHPREIAYYYDRFNRKPRSMFLDELQQPNEKNRKQINVLRKKYNVSSIELDRAKRAFQKDKKIQIWYGFQGNTR